MADEHAGDAMTQRLAVQRMTAPGVIDRSTLQRAPQASTVASAGLVDRLQRRAATSEANGAHGALPLASSVARRASGETHEQSASPASPSSANGTASTPLVTARATATVARRAEPGASSSITGTTPASLEIARAVSAAPHARATAGIPTASAQASLSLSAPTSAVARGVVQRVPERGRSPAPTTSETTTAASRAPSTPAGNGLPPAISSASGPSASLARTPSSSNGATPAPAVSTARWPVVTASSVAQTSMPHVSRKVDTTARSTPSSSGADRPSFSPSPVVGNAATPLVMRRPDITAHGPAPTSPPAISSPAITTSAPSTIARAPASPVASPHVASPGRADAAQIDWIAEQVGNRLARRFEIERERMGVRSWRP